MASRFQEALQSGKFAVTAEMNPPKGVDISEVLRKAESLKGLVTALNVTDSSSSIMTLGGLAVAHTFLDRGLEPILQVACRDRNRLALQSDLLSAHLLGVHNILCLTGDPPSAGDHPETKAVFDLEAIALLQAARGLAQGRDMAGHELKGAPSFCLGAVANPGVEPMEKEIDRTVRKAEAGARFFQTQAVFDVRVFETFMKKVGHLKVPFLAGIILLKSGNMARNLNASLPGVHVPEGLIREMDEAENKAQKSVEIAARTIKEVRGLCQGVHIMAIGWERRIPDVLKAAGLAP